MRELIFLLIGLCLGMIAGIVSVFTIMGPKLRDQFIGLNQENKPIVLDWIDGKKADFHIRIGGTVVFIGEILNMSMIRGSIPVTRVSIELQDKVEALRVTRS